MSELIHLSPEEKAEFERISSSLKEMTKNGLVAPKQLQINSSVDSSVYSDLYDIENSPMDVFYSINSKIGDNTEELKTINSQLAEEVQLYKQLNQYQKKQLDILSKLLSVNDNQYEISKEITEYLIQNNGKEFYKDKSGDVIVNLVLSAITAILRSKGCLF